MSWPLECVCLAEWCGRILHGFHRNENRLTYHLDWFDCLHTTVQTINPGYSSDHPLSENASSKTPVISPEKWSNHRHFGHAPISHLPCHWDAFIKSIWSSGKTGATHNFDRLPYLRTFCDWILVQPPRNGDVAQCGVKDHEVKLYCKRRCGPMIERGQANHTASGCCPRGVWIVPSGQGVFWSCWFNQELLPCSILFC
jgi:hypothetical protein